MPTTLNQTPRNRWQFNLWQVLVWVLILAAALGAIRLRNPWLIGGLIACGYCLLFTSFVLIATNKGGFEGAMISDSGRWTIARRLWVGGSLLMLVGAIGILVILIFEFTSGQSRLLFGGTA